LKNYNEKCITPLEKKNYFKTHLNNGSFLENEINLFSILSYCDFGSLINFNLINKNIYNFMLKNEDILWTEFIQNSTKLSHFGELDIKFNNSPSLSTLLKNYDCNNIICSNETKFNRMSLIRLFKKFKFNTFTQNSINLNDTVMNVRLLPKLFFPDQRNDGKNDFDLFQNNNMYCLFTTFKNNDLCVFDYHKNQIVKNFVGHTGQVTDTQFLFDTKKSYVNLITSSSDTRIKIWSFQNQKCISTLNGHSKVVYSIKTCLDNKLCSSSYDKTIKLWDLNNSSCITTNNSHTDIVYNIKYDGSDTSKFFIKELVISCSKDGRLLCHNIKGNSIEEVYDFSTSYEETDTSPCFCCGVNGYNVVGGYKNGKLRVWDMRKSDKVLNVLKYDGSIKDLYIDPFKIIFAEEKTISFYDLLKNEIVNEIKFDKNSFGFSLDCDDNNLITTNGFDKILNFTLI
jgi:WD40 repeat protein